MSPLARGYYFPSSIVHKPKAANAAAPNADHIEGPSIDAPLVELVSTNFIGYAGNPAHCALTIWRKVLASARDGQAFGSFFCMVSRNILAVHRHSLSENAQWLCEMAETKGLVPQAGTVMPVACGVARATPIMKANADSHRTLILDDA